MKTISQEELAYIACGNAILGSGGGGSPDYALLMAQHAFEQYGSAMLADVEELGDEDLVLPIAYIGAPLIFQEKLPSGREFEFMFQKIERDFGKLPKAVIALEIGGFNGLIALSISAKLGIPAIDGDTMGRAFPEIQMTSCHVAGIPVSPAYLADATGNVTRIDALDAMTAEKIARHVCISRGSACAIALYPMSGATAKQSIVAGTVTQSSIMGRAILESAKQGLDPISSFLQSQPSVQLAQGVITDIDQSVKEGFLIGMVTIASQEGRIEVEYKNEYLMARREGKVLASTPDILAILENTGGTPITSETLRFGLKVTLVALPAPSIWTSGKGLDLVSPQVFGYPFEYVPSVPKTDLIFTRNDL